MSQRILIAIAVTTVAFGFGCKHDGDSDAKSSKDTTGGVVDAELVSNAETAEPVVFDTLSPAPPDTIVTLDGKEVTNSSGQIDMFAWKTFIAMNWPAIEASPANGYTRGIPDTKQPFGAEALTVWETFKEKREVFNHGVVQPDGTFTPSDPGPWYAPVDYGPLRGATGAIITSSHSPGARVLHQTIKVPVFDALDETVEVKGEAREPTSPFLGQVVAPRVWRYDSATKTRTPILYEVKVNYDFYKYVVDNNLWDDTISHKLAKTNSFHLPWRTSATMKPNSSKQGPGVPAVDYKSAGVAADYGKFSAAAVPPFAPPKIGSVHIKAAWIKLSQNEINSKAFHMADAYYYASDPSGKPVAQQATFGLLGLHIIQRVHFSDKSGNFNGAGGTFVFATWEHNSIQESINKNQQVYRYANYYDPGMNGRTGPGKFGPVYDVTRRPGAILPQTINANVAVHNMFPPGSVWRNYSLIGTQFRAVDTPGGSNAPDVPFSTPPSQEEIALGQNYYLANLVIETNHGLQNFRGLPPLITLANNIVPPYKTSSFHFTGNTKGGPVFDRTAANIGLNKSTFNMGGCMGCHGVSQIQGFNFSFVLLGGNEGAKTDTETHFDLPLANADN